MDRDYITEADIDSRPTYFGLPVTDGELMTYDEWWSEFRANICCTGYTRTCPCGGYTDKLPPEVSRLLTGDDEEGDCF